MANRIPLIVNPDASQIQEFNESTDSLVGGVPLGAILMWGGGNTIPDGFTLCNATNAGTVNGIVVPDLEDKFIIGAKQHDSGWKTNITGSLGASGGTKDSVIVSHNHTTNTTIEPASVGNGAKTLTGTFGNDPHSYTPTGVFTQTTQTFNEDQDQGTSGRVVTLDVRHRHGTDDPGVSGTDQNLPPYIALAYIIRTS
tara:strand:- start:21 stop:611 length:591 start_codon:yes stop_codon:yes gene_type:complete